MKNTLSYLLYVAGTAIVVALSFVTYHVTGLHEAAESTVLKYGLGAAIAYWFVLNYRIALFGSRRTAEGRRIP